MVECCYVNAIFFQVHLSLSSSMIFFVSHFLHVVNLYTCVYVVYINIIRGDYRISQNVF